MLLSVQAFPRPDYKVTLKAEQQELKKVFIEIERQTGLYFLYSTKLFSNSSEKVSIVAKDKKLEDVLHTLLDARGVKFEFKDKAIVLREDDAVREKRAAISASSSSSLGNISLLTGTVVNHEETFLPGATVAILGTQLGTVTDAKGTFYLRDIPENAVLQIRYTGYQPEEVNVSGKTAISVKLRPGTNDLDETVVVAYGTTTQRTNTGALTVIRGEDIKMLPNRSFDKSLQGLVPGLLVTNGTGQPGGGVSNFVLRGISTGTEALAGSTVRNPLIVIDGIIVNQNDFQINRNLDATSVSNPMAQLNPSDIESITVLKDASAIALYGSKASNGVIVVTTKRGKIGKTTFQFGHQSDFHVRPPQTIKNVTTEEYLDLLYESYKNKDAQLWTDQAIRKDLFTKFPYIVSGNDTSFYPSSDWTNELYNKIAYTNSNQLSMTGGNDKSRFYLNLEFTGQDGIAKKTGYDRKSLRFNFETAPTNWLKLLSNTVISYNVQDFSNQSESAVTFAAGPVMSPLNPIRDQNGNYILSYLFGSVNTKEALSNPVAVTAYNLSRNTAYRALSELKGEINFLKHFKLSSLAGIDFMLAEIKDKKDPRFGIAGTEFGSIGDKDQRVASFINTNLLEYQRIFNSQHMLNLLLGQEAQILSEKFLFGEVRGTSTTNPYYDEITSPGYNIKTLSGGSAKQLLQAYFAQGNYKYKNKYLLNATIRRDGSSKFGAQQKWGNYWSSGAGWVVTEESFLKDNTSNWLSYLKLRGSLGVAGSSGAIEPNVQYELLTPIRYNNTAAVISGNSPANTNIRWEKTFSWNIGLDLALLKDRFRLTTDVYSKKTRDVIYSLNLPSIAGFTKVPANIGDINNEGIEVTLQTRIIKSKSFRWNLNANWSTNRNILTKANVNLSSVSGAYLGNEVGRNFNSFYLREWAGVDPNDGKPLWIDSTGKPNSKYNAAKQKFVGKPQPDGFGAVTNILSYKDITLAVQFNYQYGAMVYDLTSATTLLTDGALPYINMPVQALDRWQKPGDIAANPRRVLNNTDGGTGASTRYLVSGDYIRLQNVQLGYNFPPDLLRTIRINTLNVYLQGNNIATWATGKNINPDNTRVTGSNGYAYPVTASYSIGFNIGF